MIFVKINKRVNKMSRLRKYSKTAVVLLTLLAVNSFLLSSSLFTSLSFWYYFLYPAAFLVPVQILMAKPWCRIKYVEYFLYFVAISMTNEFYIWLWGLPVSFCQYLGDGGMLLGVTISAYVIKRTGHIFRPL